MNFINRDLSSKIKAVRNTPVITITGARQTGKTTLAKELFPDYMYFNLEFPDVRNKAKLDPRGFLSQSNKMIIDEIQWVPELFSYIQGFVDEDKEKRYILTGSNNFNLLHKISQSLAGRVALFFIPPLSLHEIKKSNHLDKNLYKNIYNGGYPRIVNGSEKPEDWYRSYVQTYLEKDIRDTASIHMMDRFFIFLQVLATRVGNILNYTNIANEVQVSSGTIRDWVSILEASYIIYKINPYHENIRKRLVKSPKIYFNDTGLLCSLLNIRNQDDVQKHVFSGFIFENFIINEYLKKELLENNLHNLFFYRDHDGNEVDLIIERETNKVELYEIKLHKTFSKEFTKGLEFLSNELQISNTKNVVYGGDENYKINDANIISWRNII